MAITEATLGMLSQDIASEDRWNEVYDRLMQEGVSVDSISLPKPFSGIYANAWYQMRETFRMGCGVYKTTSVLDNVNKLIPGYFIHIKVGHEDKQMVAYTSSAEDAKRDKKHLVRLGRLLAKLVPLFTDTYINELCATHVQESDPTLEILFGSDNIVHAYVNGPSSCMTKDASEYNGKDEHGNRHMPVEVYGTPRIGIAVTRDGEGRINGRCLVIPAKMEFIRVYGSPVLLKKLEMNGYKPGTLVGEELLKVVLYTEDTHLNGKPSKKVTVLSPYLDGNAGQGNTEWSCVALIDGKFRVISGELRDRLTTIYKDVSNVFAYSTSTGGSVTLHDLKSDDILLRDGITGEVVPDGTEMQTYFYKGAIVLASRVSWFMHTEGPYVTAKCLNSGSLWVDVLMQRKDAFYFDGNYRAPTTEFMKKYGIYPLDPTHYPGETRLIRAINDDYVISGKPDANGNNTYIKKSDSRTMIHMVDGSAERYYEHKSLETKGRGLVKVHRLRGAPDVYAEKDVPLLKTNTGRKVIEGVHNIVQLWTGEWALRQTGLSRASLFGEYMYYMGDMPKELGLGGFMWVAKFRQMLTKLGHMDLHNFVSAVQTVCSVAVYNQSVTSWSIPNARTFDRIAQTEQLPADTPRSQLERLYVEKVVQNAAISGIWQDGMGLSVEEGRVLGAPFIRELADLFIQGQYLHAECTAVDYNQPTDNHYNPTPVEVIDNPNIEVVVVELEGAAS